MHGIVYEPHGSAVYCMYVQKSTGDVFSFVTDSAESYNEANYDDYVHVVPLTGPNTYSVSEPASITDLASYQILYYDQLGVSPSASDPLVPLAYPGGVVDANVVQVQGDSTVADKLRDMLDGTGGVDLMLKSITVNNPSGPGVRIQGSTYGLEVEGGTAPMRVVDGSGNPAKIDANLSGRVLGETSDTISGIGAQVSADSLLDAPVDQVTFGQVLRILLAVLAGKTAVEGNTVTFFRRDGSTAALRLSYGGQDGLRLQSQIEDVD